MEEALTPKPRRQGGVFLPRYDEKLRQAKNEGKSVRLVLGGECVPYTDDDYAVVGKIMEVDKFTLGLSIPDNDEIIFNGKEKLVWFSKAAIISTEVLG